MERLSALLTGKLVMPKGKMIMNGKGKELHFVAIGDEGMDMLRHFFQKGDAKKFTCINTSFKSEFLMPNSMVTYSLPENAYTNLSKIKMDIEVVRQQNGLPKNIKDIFSDREKHYVVFAALGHFMGSYLSREISTMLHENGIGYTSIVVLPMNYSGAHARNAAIELAKEMEHLPNVNIIDMEQIIPKGEGLTMAEVNDLFNMYLHRLYRFRDNFQYNA